ncbi:MAG: ABC transporter permease [bacterium]|nr:ABC transporter permease [bacterium]
MSGTAIIAKREYAARIRSKGFWISTIALPVLMAAWAILPSLILSKTKADHRLAVVDLTGTLASRLSDELAGIAERTGDRVFFDLELVEASTPHEELRDDLDRRALAQEIDAWLWIEADALEDGLVEYHAESLSNFITQSALERALSRVARRERFARAGFDATAIEELSGSIDLETVKVAADGSREGGGFAGFALAVGLFIILYTTTLIYGQQVMLGVLDEKSSRVVEVLVSSVKPIELLGGKLIGIGLIGLTQLSIWLLTAILLTAPGLLVAGSLLPEGVNLPTITVAIGVNFILLFLLGYFLYSSFYAMVGSAFNNPQEAQQLASLAVVFIVLPWIFFMPILNDPDSTLAVVTSLIPPFTPSLMMLRIATKMPPLWQILLGYALTVAACFGMMWLSARVYRVGILMYGKKPTFRELWRWIRYA